MKKILIASSPLFAAMFVLVWILVGLKDALIFIGALLLMMVLGGIFVKWMKFVDEHVK